MQDALTSVFRRYGLPATMLMDNGSPYRTLKFEVLRHFNYSPLAHCQRELDHFRDRYSLHRPHDALNLAYSRQPLLAEGWVSYRGHAFRVCKALRGLPVALRPVPEADVQWEVLFCHQVVARIDLNLAHAPDRD